MGDRRFRFGVVVGRVESGEQWRTTARRAEDLGYDTFLMPDGPHLVAPMPALAVAASVTTRLRVGTFVLASTVRPPKVAAWEAHSLSILTDNRFEMGIGTGNQWVNRRVVEDIGLPETTPGQRLAQVRDTVEALRALDTDARTPVMIAAGGPRSRALAGEVADIVTLPHPPFASRADVRKLVDETRDAAGGRADEIEFSMNVLAVGGAMSPALEALAGADAKSLAAGDSLFSLTGTPREMADEVLRRRDEIGYSYITLNGLHFEAFTPVIELLQGQ
jgi:alkanesulfonate monooxygenase SsuD/methylene tetrahydromethanopterin reductase-like flavin-dependent oxidoreductase (luciferase family)